MILSIENTTKADQSVDGTVDMYPEEGSSIKVLLKCKHDMESFSDLFEALHERLAHGFKFLVEQQRMLFIKKKKLILYKI